MDPISIISTIASASHASKQAGLVTYQLYLLIQNTRNVNESVRQLQLEVKLAGDICEAVRDQLKPLSKENFLHTPLLNGIDSQLCECATAITQIKDSIQSVGKDSRNFLQHTLKQIKLNLKQNEIDESRRRIQSCTLNLQVSLQLVNIQAVHLAPAIANEVLIDKLEDLHKILSLQGGKLDDSTRKRAGEYLTKGTSLYTGSVASTSAAGDRRDLSKVPVWLDQLNNFRQNQRRDSIVPSVYGGTNGGLRRKNTDNTVLEILDDEDELAVQLTGAAYRIGRLNFETQDYKTSEVMLHECLTAMESLTVRQRKYDFEEIHLMLAICSFWNNDHDLNEAIGALVSVLSRELESDENVELHFEASKLLVASHMCQNQLDLARSVSESMHRAASRLFSPTDRKCYTAIALLVRVFERQNMLPRAELYRSLVPDEQASVIFEATDHTLSKVQHMFAVADIKGKDQPHVPDLALATATKNQKELDFSRSTYNPLSDYGQPTAASSIQQSSREGPEIRTLHTSQITNTHLEIEQRTKVPYAYPGFITPVGSHGFSILGEAQDSDEHRFRDHENIENILQFVDSESDITTSRSTPITIPDPVLAGIQNQSDCSLFMPPEQDQIYELDSMPIVPISESDRRPISAQENLSNTQAEANIQSISSSMVAHIEAYSNRRTSKDTENTLWNSVLALIGVNKPFQSLPESESTSSVPAPILTQPAIKQALEMGISMEDSASKSAPCYSWRLRRAARVLTCSNDHTVLACAGDVSYEVPGIDLYSLETGIWKCQLSNGDLIAVTCLAFDVSGSRLASGHGGLVESRFLKDIRKPLQVCLWDIETGSMLFKHSHAPHQTGLSLRTLQFASKHELISTYNCDVEIDAVDSSTKLSAGYFMLDVQKQCTTIENDIGAGRSLIRFSKEYKQAVVLKNSFEISVCNFDPANMEGQLKSRRLNSAYIDCVFGPENTIAVLYFNGTVTIFKNYDIQLEQQMHIRPPEHATDMKGKVLALTIHNSCMAFTSSKLLVVALVLHTTDKRQTLCLAAPESGVWQPLVTTRAIHAICFSSNAEWLICTSQEASNISQCLVRQWNITDLLQKAQKLGSKPIYQKLSPSFPWKSVSYEDIKQIGHQSHQRYGISPPLTVETSLDVS